MEIKENITLNKQYGFKITDLEIVKVIGDFVYVTNGKKYGLISLKNKNPYQHFIMEPIYEFIGDFIDGIAIFKKDGKYGLINQEGKIIVENYECIEGPHYNGIYIYKNSNVYSLMDKLGNSITQYTYVYMYKCDNHMFTTKRGKLKGLINDQGLEILKPSHNSIYIYQKYIVASNDCYNTDKKSRYGLYDLKGQEILPCKYLNIEGINDDYLLLKLSNHKYQIYNITTKTIKNISGIHHNDFCQPFNDKYIGKYSNRKNGMGLIDLEGNIVLKPTSISLINRNDGMISFSYSNTYTYGLFNDKLEIIFPNEYSQIGWYQNGIAKAYKNNKSLFLDDKGNTISKEYALVSILNDNIVGTYEDGMWNLIKYPFDKNNPDVFLKCTKFERITDDIFWIEKGNKQGFIDGAGNFILNFQEKSFHKVKCKGNIIYFQDIMNNYYLIDLKGKFLVNGISAKQLLILNDNQIIVDNYLYNLDNIKYQYNSIINYENQDYFKSFDNIELRRAYHTYLKYEAYGQIQQAEKEYLKQCEQLRDQKDNKIKQLIKDNC